ncbi:MAG TPA: Na/Pi cotransporter family protein [Firmicutes bacterium]|jgi:phosphate:Na+ symporter|nr:Na/Pi cotransporter family protein [Bacillota bacterium]
MAIFLLGLRLLTNVLETVLGFRLHTALNRFTASRAQSFLVGFAVTAFIQSSSAVGAAMVVLTDTGVLSLTQALGVMLGANVGTTITAQIIALPLEDMALPLCAAGLAVRFFFRRRRAGAAIFSLGAIFFGLSCAAHSLAPLLELPAVYAVLAVGTKTSCRAVLCGLVLTAVVQSSSTVTGLVIALVREGILSVPAAIAMALGSNVGTVATTIVASLGRKRASRATACADLFFNLGGLLLVLPVFPLFMHLIAHLSSDPGRQVAHAHTFFNAFTALLALPFLEHLAALAWWGAGIGARTKN